ncbi:monovalent cation/H(+) antiporter subunit G [Aquipuribacter nitratireducens]|uniref:Monovalent cation/H(+) antiporter subunit G n=1 Tax=Aquipuribacter nitratireducens TaxID=650104 RepID=A0ABW0GSV7_9MICO
MTALADVVAALLLLTGCALTLVASVALFRLPGVSGRLQAATKGQIVGLVLVVVGASLRLRDPAESVELWLVALFQVTTAPVLAQVLGRTAHARGEEQGEELVVDELARAEASRDRGRRPR